MNERIKELAEQCWEARKYGPPWFEYEKFAELIIKECIWIAYNHMSLHKSSEQYKFTDHLDAIKERFGLD